MKLLNDLSVVFMAVGLAIMVIGFAFYCSDTIDSSLYEQGLGIVFVGIIGFIFTGRK